MQHKKEILLGLWSIIAITAIFFTTLIVIGQTSTAGAYSASTAFLQYTPKEMCDFQGCEGYLTSDFVRPSVLSSTPVTVDCICNGEIVNYPLLLPNLGVNNINYYPKN